MLYFNPTSYLLLREELLEIIDRVTLHSMVLFGKFPIGGIVRSNFDPGISFLSISRHTPPDEISTIVMFLKLAFASSFIF